MAIDGGAWIIAVAEQSRFISIFHVHTTEVKFATPTYSRCILARVDAARKDSPAECYRRAGISFYIRQNNRFTRGNPLRGLEMTPATLEDTAGGYICTNIAALRERQDEGGEGRRRGCTSNTESRVSLECRERKPGTAFQPRLLRVNASLRVIKARVRVERDGRAKMVVARGRSEEHAKPHPLKPSTVHSPR